MTFLNTEDHHVEESAEQRSLKGSLRKKGSFRETIRKFSRISGRGKRLDTTNMPSRYFQRRNAVQLKSHGADFTIQDGSWKLWADTISNEEMNEFKEVFAMYDKDRDGSVQAKELGQILKCYGQNPTEDEIQEMIAEADTDASGSIEFPEFVTMMAKRRKNSAEDMRQAFQAFDEDGDGMISADELMKFLSTTGECLSAGDLQEIMNEVDADGNGSIDYEEFVNMMTGDL